MNQVLQRLWYYQRADTANPRRLVALFCQIITFYE